MMYLLIILGILIVAEILFLKYSNSLGLMDIPNDRSSHTRPTVRGAGFVIILGALLALLFYDVPGRWFLVGGGLLVALIGFIDDVRGSTPIVRTLFQVSAILLMLHGLDVLLGQNIALVALVLVVCVGTINAVNFMDGINGISVLYGGLMVATFLYLNEVETLLPRNFLLAAGSGIVVFGSINVRNRALAFAGDVGSTGLGFLLVYLTLTWMFNDNSLVYFLLWAVYGVDSTLTIVERLLKKQNIFGAHRSHLYQLLSNEMGWGHLKVSLVYTIIQLGINLIALYLIANKTPDSWWITTVLLLFMGVVYMVIKQQIKSKIRKSSNP